MRFTVTLMADTAPQPDPTHRRTIVGRPRFAGTVGAVVFLWASFWPTLMPRTFLTQGAMSGLSAAIGYAIFTLFGWLVGLVLSHREISIGASARRAAWIVLGVIGGAAVAIGGLGMWVRWQNDQRDLLGMNDLSVAIAIPMLVVAAIVFVVFVLIGRLIGRGVVHLYRLISRALSPQFAVAATAGAVVLIAAFLVNDVVADRFTDWANSAFGTIDDGTAEGIEQPDSPTVSGSPDSLADWDTLGLQGRTFVASATPSSTIIEFQDSIGNDVEVVEPIRVYAGIDSADDVQDRADLAVAELERTGAFDRDVLAVVTVTGTGWIDPDAAEALEVMHAGNTAMVGIQYSFLPSWIATLLADGASTEAGAVLFDTVYETWAELPESDRPELIIYGLSLGSHGAEAAFAGTTADNSIANLTARADGALLGGPTNANEVWAQITTDREDGSPVWKPEYDGGATVRFANGADDLVDVDPAWEAPRLLYVQHPSDPVTFWNVSDFWSPPPWMDDPRGPDVPEGGPWFPIVTGLQGVFDLMAGFGAPAGHGHDYRLAWPGAWAQVVPPNEWVASDTEALSTFLADQRAAADAASGN
jgi:uncharacterized membrane protein